MSNALALRDPQNVAISQPNANKMNLTLDETIKLAEVFAQSGLFADIKGAAQAVTKIIAGRELGFPPMASLTGIYIVKGRVTMSANLIAAAIQRSGKYSYRVVEMTNKLCTINFYEQGQQIGASTFDEKDAQDAGLLNNDSWKKFRRNMLFARALTNGARWFTPEIFAGAIYTPDELGAEINDEGTPVGNTSGNANPLEVEMLPPAKPTRKERLIQRIYQLWLEEDALKLMVVEGDRPASPENLTEPELELLGKRISQRIKSAKEDILAREYAQANQPSPFEQASTATVVEATVAAPYTVGEMITDLNEATINQRDEINRAIGQLADAIAEGNELGIKGGMPKGVEGWTLESIQNKTAGIRRTVAEKRKAQGA